MGTRIVIPLIVVAFCLGAGGMAGAVQSSGAAPAPSGDWRVVVTDTEDDIGRLFGFADAGTISRSGDRVRFWLEYRLERPSGGGDGYRGYVSADCVGRTYASSDLSQLAGAQVLATGGAEPEAPVTPGTNIAVALDNVCAGRFLSGRVDPIAYSRTQFGQ